MASAAVKGRVSLCEDELHVSFPYNKARFDAIRKIEGVSYDKEQKYWRVPLREAPLVVASPLFSPAAIHYEFDRNALNAALRTYETRMVSSRERHKTNPFSVSEDDIKALDLDVVFRLSKQGTSIRATLRFRTKAKKLLKSVEGAHYLKPEKAFYVPAVAIHDLMKKLRDKSVPFGVETRLGERLKRSAALRTLIAQGKYKANHEELAECLLVPYLDERTDGAFSLHEWTTEQLGICFPQSGSFNEKKGHAARLSEDELLSVLHRAEAKGLRLYKTAGVLRRLEALRDRVRASSHTSEAAVPDVLLGFLDVKGAWITWHDGKGGLLAAKIFLDGLPQEAREALEKGEPHPHPNREETIFIRFRDSELLCAYESFGSADGARNLPETESFRLLIAELGTRRALLEERKRFQSLRDIDLALANAGLGKRLYPHQRVAAHWILEHHAGILGDDMGLGKTLSILCAFEELKARDESDFLLVACPNSLVRNWIREAEQWTPSLRLQALPSVKKDKERVLTELSTGAAQADGLVVNYENLRLESVAPRVRELCAGRRVFLCLDESQRVKNAQSKTFKALNALAPHCARRFLLSGTPVPRDIADIWAQMLIVDKGARFGTRYYEWLPRVAELGNKWSEFAVKRFIPEEVNETILRVQEVLLRRKKEEVVKLPPKIFSFRDIDLSGEQKKRYEEICDELILRVTRVGGDEFVRSIESLLEEYLRAVQVASNPRLVDPQWKGEPAKFLELDELVNDIVRERGEKIVIWTNYRKNVEELVDRYKEYNARPFTGDVSQRERAELIGQFQEVGSATPRILVAIPAAGGVGITLTAAQTAVYVDRTWNAEHWLQSIDRIHRIGQKGAVNIIVLNACKVDELIGFNLRRKEKMQETLLKGQVLPVESLYPSRDELLHAATS